MQRVIELNAKDAELRGELNYAVQLMSSIYASAFTRHGPFTLFLATDQGFRNSLTSIEVL